MRSYRVGILMIALAAGAAAVLLTPDQAQAHHRFVVSVGGGWYGGGFAGGWCASPTYVPYYSYPRPVWTPAPYYGGVSIAVPYYYAPRVQFGWHGGWGHFHRHWR